MYKRVGGIMGKQDLQLIQQAVYMGQIVRICHQSLHSKKQMEVPEVVHKILHPQPLSLFFFFFKKHSI